MNAPGRHRVIWPTDIAGVDVECEGLPWHRDHVDQWSSDRGTKYRIVVKRTPLGIRYLPVLRNTPIASFPFRRFAQAVEAADLHWLQSVTQSPIERFECTR